MADNKLHITAELIRRYHEGTLDDRTMHAIERQALDDPFLAEALEGYGLHQPDQQPALSALQKRLEQRVNTPKKGLLRRMETRWMAAAAVLVLLCVTAVIWMNRGSQRNIVQADPLKKADTAVPRPAQSLPGSENAAEEKSAAGADNSSSGNSSSPAGEQARGARPQQSDRSEASTADERGGAKSHPSVSKTQSANEQALAKTHPSISKTQPANEQALAKTHPSVSKTQPANEQALAKSHPIPSNRQSSAATNPPPPPAKPRSFGKAQAPAVTMVPAYNPSLFKGKVDTIMIRGIPAQDSQALATRTNGKVEGYIAGEPARYSDYHTDENVRRISGIVIDERTGNRLPGVMVSVNGVNRGAVTDTAGGFALHVDKKEEVQLGFSSLGYEKKNITVARNTSNVNVSLPASGDALQEVVVVGYDRKQAKKAAPVPPAPFGGERAYQAYLASRKVIPAAGETAPVKGEVHISFTVMPDSTLRNFRVLRGLSSVADKAAIRIVKEGPEWIPASNKRRAKVELKVPVEIVQ